MVALSIWYLYLYTNWNVCLYLLLIVIWCNIITEWWFSCPDSFWSESKSDKRDDDDDADDVDGHDDKDKDDNDDNDVNDASCSCPDSF